MTTISNTITRAVHYGIGPNYGSRAGYYTAPLTITNTGFINFAGSGAAVSGTGASSLVNQGSIVASGFAAPGVEITGPGTVINSGLIQGYFEGLIMSGGGAVINSGRIIADGESPLAGGGGVIMPGGGSFTNLAAGYVNFGVLLNVNSDGAGFNVTLANAGTITDGVVLNSNFSYNPATGQTTTEFIGTGTIFDSGTISGGPNSAGIAIYMGGSNAVLVLEAGYRLNGPAKAGGTFPHTLELEGTGASPVIVNFNTTEFNNFGTVGFAAGSTNAGTLELATTADLPGTVIGFTAPHDVIDLQFVSDTGNNATATLNPVNDQLTVVGDNGSTVLRLDPTENYNGLVFSAVPDAAGTGTDVSPVICFCDGTQILTDSGEVAVEALKIGDHVVLAGGGTAPITWIGEGRVLATRGRRTAATPVIVRRGALADNVPNWDLRITKAHSLYIDDVLIPVEFLVNHRSILWDDRALEVSVYHIELAAHDVLIANGTPAESYRDDGNRWLFRNANSGWDSPPRPACAPVLTGGPVVDAVWRRLLDRAGHPNRLPLTNDPDLHLVVDGVRVDAARLVDGAYVFDLSGRPETVRIMSRAAIPQELGLVRDSRSLGVALRRIVVRQGNDVRVIEANDVRLDAGFHSFEVANGFRWTGGDAAMPNEAFAGSTGPITIELAVASTMKYLDEGDRLMVA